MDRRTAAILLLSVAAAPLVSRSQQQKVWRVGVLAPRRRPDSIDADFLGSFPRAMRELGYVEGKNLSIEWRFADGDPDRLSELAGDLVRLRLDAIVSGSAQAISALQKRTTTVPIVMAAVGDPIGSGFVKSLARPEGNITGLSSLASDIGSKQLELLIVVVPRLARVGMIVNPANPTLSTLRDNVRSAAQRQGVVVQTLEARTATEIERAFAAMTQAQAGAVIVPADGFFVQQYRAIAELAMSARLPSVSLIREYAELGGLMSYGPNFADQFRRAATYVDKIFKGTRPGDLPVEQSSTFELAINRMTARALGVAVPDSVLLRADRVIG